MEGTLVGVGSTYEATMKIYHYTHTDCSRATESCSRKTNGIL